MEFNYKKTVSIIGQSNYSEKTSILAYQTGRLLGEAGFVIICGGGTGVMEYAAKGAKDAGGVTVGILPGNSPDEANPYIDIIIPCGTGQARNIAVVNSGKVVVSIGKGIGTLSETAFAVKAGKYIISLESWEVDGVETIRAASPQEVLEIVSGLVFEV